MFIEMSNKHMIGSVALPLQIWENENILTLTVTKAFQLISIKIDSAFVVKDS